MMTRFTHSTPDWPYDVPGPARHRAHHQAPFFPPNHQIRPSVAVVWLFFRIPGVLV